MGETTVRSFLALPFSTKNKLSVFGEIEPFAKTYSTFRFIPYDNWHLTLHFFGNLKAGQIEKLRKELTPFFLQVNPLKLWIETAGAFPTVAKARLLWLGVQGDIEKLALLSKSLNERLNELGFEIEKRGFKPHLTIARLKSPVRSLRVDLKKIGNISSAPEIIRSAVLYQSVLSSNGSKYIPLAEFQFSQ